MTYTGDDIIFGVKRTVNDTCEDMLKYIEKNHDEIYNTIDVDLLQSEYNYRDKTNYLIDIMQQLKLSITIISEHCCFFNDKKNTYIFIGALLASNDTIDKRHVNEFNSFMEYKDFYTIGLKYATEALKKNKTTYIKDINKFVDDKDIPIKFYSMPNDCFACT